LTNVYNFAFTSRGVHKEREWRRLPYVKNRGGELGIGESILFNFRGRGEFYVGIKFKNVRNQ
jgi:hypothetical protein